MKHLLAVVLIAVAGMFTAGQVASGAGMEPVGPAGVGPAGVATMGAPFDQQFIDEMAAHHQMAIEMARTVLMNARLAQTKTIALKIISAQQQEISTLHKLRKQWYGKAAFKNYKLDAMKSMMRSMGMKPGSKMMMMMQSMGMKPGSAATDKIMQSGRPDYTFLTEMIPHHAAAITMAEWELKSGTHPALKLIARKIIRDQAMEIGEMINLRVNWYGA